MVVLCFHLEKLIFLECHHYQYQNPLYQDIYLNTNRLEDPEELFEESDQSTVGNATVGAEMDVICDGTHWWAIARGRDTMSFASTDS